MFKRSLRLNPQEEEKMLTGLSAPEKSFRLEALQLANQVVPTEELKKALIARKEVETDRECRYFLDFLCQDLDLDPELSPAPEGPIDTATISETFSSAGPREKLVMLSRIPKDKTSSLIHLAPDWLQSEKNPAVASAIILTFYRDWPPNQYAVLAKCLIGKYIGVRLAALEALNVLAPGQLIQALPKLLVSRDPRIWSMAIQALVKIDLKEALMHLEQMLLHGDRTRRLMGIQCGLVLPFDKIKPVLLNMFAAESDPELIHKAGLVFQTNPDPDVPYRLWEIVENSPSEKAAGVKKILEGALEVLQKASVLMEPFPEYVKKLQAWISHRVGVKFVQGCLSQLDADPALESEIFNKLLEKLSKPGVRGALKEALTWPIEASALALIENVLEVSQRASQIQEETTRKKKAASAKLQKQWDPGLSVEEKIRVISGWGKESASDAKPIIEDLITNESSLLPLQTAAMRAAIRMEMNDYIYFARKWLGNMDISLSIAAMEYHAHFQPEGMLPILEKIVKKGETKQKVVALKLLNQHFPGKAENILASMLREEAPERRASALVGMICVDFTLVREALTAFLEENIDRELLTQGLFLFQTNPDFENLYCLYRIEQAVDEESKLLVQEARKKVGEMLVNFNRLNAQLLPDFEEEFKTRWKTEKARKSALPSYAVELLKKHL